MLGRKIQISSSPRGSVWSFAGGVLLSFSLGLAVRTFWSDLEKSQSRLLPEADFKQVPRVWEDSSGLGSTFWPGDLFGIKNGSRKTYFCDDIIL